jgi:hypothetical protein
MFSRYGLSLAALFLAASCQFWFMGGLLLSRQIEALLLGGIIACVFWGWLFWVFLVRKQCLGLAIAGFCLFISIAINVLCLMDALDKTGVSLFSEHGCVPLWHAEEREASTAASAWASSEDAP